MITCSFNCLYVLYYMYGLEQGALVAYGVSIWLLSCVARPSHLLPLNLCLGAGGCGQPHCDHALLKMQCDGHTNQIGVTITLHHSVADHSLGSHPPITPRV